MPTSFNPWGIGSYGTPTVAPMPTPVSSPVLPLRPRGTTLRPSGTITHGINPMYAPAGSTEQNWPYGLPGTIGPYGVIGSDGAPMQYGLNALAGLNGATSPLTTNAGATGSPFSTLRNVKNPEQEARIGQVAADFDTARTTTSNALAEFTKKFLGNTPAAERNVAQENAVVEGYYSGEVGNTLAAMLAKRSQAAKDSQLLAFDHARRLRASNALLRPGGTNSFQDRLELGKTNDLYVQLALDEAEQVKKNWEYVQAGKLGLRGAQTNALDALANRALVPADAQNRALSELLQRLESVGHLDLANTFYGLQKPYDPNTEGYISDMSGGGGGYFGGPRRQQYSNQPVQNRGPFGIGATVRPPATTQNRSGRWDLPQADYSNMGNYPLLTPQYQVNPGQSVPIGSEYLDPIAGNIQGSSYLDQYYGYPGYFDQYAPGIFNNGAPPSTVAPPYDPYPENLDYLQQYYG